MNKIFTLITAIVCLTGTTKAQVILNEIYTDPGSGKHEFFELYNSNSLSISMDGYTVMSYFEEGSSRGFYILDLPNLTVAARGYFTGAAATPFNYQANVNSNAAQFSWNDPQLLTNFGYLRKWVDNGNNLTDGIRIMIWNLSRRGLMISLLNVVVEVQPIMHLSLKTVYLSIHFLVE